jgi:hypothetical protein
MMMMSRSAGTSRVSAHEIEVADDKEHYQCAQHNNDDHRVLACVFRFRLEHVDSFPAERAFETRLGPVRLYDKRSTGMAPSFSESSPSTAPFLARVTAPNANVAAALSVSKTALRIRIPCGALSSKVNGTGNRMTELRTSLAGSAGEV